MTTGAGVFIRGLDQNVIMPKDSWFDPIPINDLDDLADLPNELRDFIKKWQAIAIEESKHFTREWFVKNPDIRFVYDYKYYVLGPYTVCEETGRNQIGGLYELFESLSRRMEDELRRMGAPYVNYTGMLD